MKMPPTFRATLLLNDGTNVGPMMIAGEPPKVGQMTEIDVDHRVVKARATRVDPSSGSPDFKVHFEQI